MRTTNALVLYKRHTSTCEVHKTRLPAAKKNFWFQCDCMIHIYGRSPAGDIIPRQSTGCRSVKEAEAFRATFLGKEAAQAESVAKNGMTFDEAVKRYLVSTEHLHSEGTESALRALLGKFREYCARDGVLHIRQLTEVDLLERFKEDVFAGYRDSTKKRRTSHIRCFLRVAFRRGWITVPLADKLTAHVATHDPKEPYTDAEVPRILDGAAALRTKRPGYSSKPQTFRLLLELMLVTGLRVSDAVAFDPAVLRHGGGVWIYEFIPKKSRKGREPKRTEVYLSDETKTAIDNADWFSADRPFAYGGMKNFRLAYLVNRVMNKIGKTCGVPDCRPHRLRDTFAVRLLCKGVSLDDVSRLLGHASVKTTEMYYARWTLNREVRLQGIMAQTFLNTPDDTLRD